MRDWLIKLWRKIQKSKKTVVFTKFIVWLIETDLFNILMDFIERVFAKKKLRKRQEFYRANRRRIKENIEILADEKSKKVYSDIIMYRCTLDRRYLVETSSAKEKYFDSQIISFVPDELFIDGGAYIGDTIISLVERWPFFNKNGKKSLNVLCFEPDGYNVKELIQNVSQISKQAIHFSFKIVQSAMWNRNVELEFEGGIDYASKLEKTGNEKVRAQRLDDIIGELYPGEKVTFLKLDIEGAEPEALEGASATIEKDHPILAICIYHTDEQMISIIETIRGKYPFYKLYVRHYMKAWTETVIYAIPDD